MSAKAQKIDPRLMSFEEASLHLGGLNSLYFSTNPTKDSLVSDTGVSLLRPQGTLCALGTAISRHFEGTCDPPKHRFAEGSFTCYCGKMTRKRMT